LNAVSGVRVQDGPGIPEVPRTFQPSPKRWPTARTDATTLDALQALLRAFQIVYNHKRPH